MASKKSNKNAMKKIDKQLDKLLKEKKEIEDIPIISRKEINKKAIQKNNDKKTTSQKVNKTSSSNNKKQVTKKNNRKSEAIVVKERKGKNSKKKKKVAVVVPERKTNIQKNKPIEKKELPKKVERVKKVSESTIKLQKLEEEIRTLYEKEEFNKAETESTKTIDVVPDNDIIISDVINHKDDIENDYDSGNRVLNIIILILFIIFLIMFLIFIGFIIYVCTY